MYTCVYTCTHGANIVWATPTFKMSFQSLGEAIPTVRLNETGLMAKFNLEVPLVLHLWFIPMLLALSWVEHIGNSSSCPFKTCPLMATDSTWHCEISQSSPHHLHVWTWWITLLTTKSEQGLELIQQGHHLGAVRNRTVSAVNTGGFVEDTDSF